MRGARSVLGGECAVLLQKCGKAALSYSTPSSTHPSTLPTGSLTFTPLEDPTTNRKERFYEPEISEGLRGNRQNREEGRGPAGAAQGAVRQENRAGKP